MIDAVSICASFCLPISHRLYSDIEAILANLFLNRKSQDRETGYGGRYKQSQPFLVEARSLSCVGACSLSVLLYVCVDTCIWQMS